MGANDDKLQDLLDKVKDPEGIVLMERLQIIIDIIMGHQVVDDTKMNDTLMSTFSRLQYATKHCTSRDIINIKSKLVILKRTILDIMEEIETIDRIL